MSFKFQFDWSKSLLPILVLLGSAASAGLAQAPASQSPQIPAWQLAAGGKMTFEVASVREDPTGKYQTPPYSIDSDDDGDISSSGIFLADLPLTSYISFAYKLDQQHPMLEHLPEWVKNKHFVIQARVPGKPTKDQLRLMMQSLLADRFKLELHFETETVPVLFMTLIKPGKNGAGLRQHSDGPPCTVVVPHPPNSTASFDMFPCNVYLAINQADHTILAGARNTTVELMAAFFTNVGHMRPIVNETGLSGKIDFSMVYTPEPKDPLKAGTGNEEEFSGTTFLEAIKDQLGLKLEPGKSPIPIPVVDHVEMPSQN